MKRWFDRPKPVPAVRDDADNPRWTLEMLIALGRVPDREIARRFVLTFEEIRAKRHERRVPSKAWGKREWTPEMIADLKVMYNLAFQNKYQLDGLVVASKRKELQFPLLERGAHFTPQMIALLGKRTDKQLARSFMLTQPQVMRKRNQLGIPSYAESHQRRWTSEEIALLGTMDDLLAAKRLGVSVREIQNLRRQRDIAGFQAERWTPEILALLGKVMDSEIATKLGVSDALVTQKRKAMGIPRFSRNKWTKKRVKALGTAPDKTVAKKIDIHWKTVAIERRRRKIPPFPYHHRWADAELRMLGAMPDAAIAERLGVSVISVTVKRNQLHIPVFRPDAVRVSRAGRT
jgi:hypothetical protein